jgi:signal transduction histidine kinase
MLKRIGIQKRIMAYVTIGLLLLFGGFSYLGVQAVGRSAELVAEERLASARGIAFGIGQDLGLLAKDVEEKTSTITADVGGIALTRRLHEASSYLTSSDGYPFFRVTGLSLLDSGGRVLASTSPDTVKPDQQGLRFELTQSLVGQSGPRVLWLEDGHPDQFATVAVPLVNAQGETWSWAVVGTEVVRRPYPFLAFGLFDPMAGEEPIQVDWWPKQARYHLEVVTFSGTTVLGIGPDEHVGHQSVHYPLIKDLMEAGESDVLIHRAADTKESEDHMIAITPIPESNAYLVLEQDKDAALALPNEFRRRLILGGSIGFVMALLVAWVTTRHVVKPTEELTAAADRMAKGDLSSSISVRAQDEIGVLAERLDTMRLQLRDALGEVAASNRELEARVEQRTSQLHELMGRVFNAQEEEKQRIALELHDETAQTLTAITVALDSLSHGSSSDLTREQRDRIRDARRMATEVLQETRRLIYALRPVALDEMGLVVALRAFAQDLLESSGVDIHMTTDGRRERLGGQLELSLYRIGQEALNNVAKHAKARNVWVDIEYGDSRLRLTVRDDGIGFHPGEVGPASSPMKGIGLDGIRERASLVGGVVAVQSKPGSGTTIRVEVPRNNHG